jgi:hypothetical protein
MERRQFTREPIRGAVRLAERSKPRATDATTAIH